MFDPKDVVYRYTKGKGPGGQHKNKVETCVIATHVPTGLSVRSDGRNREQNKKQAIKELEARYIKHLEDAKAASKKSRRDQVIHERNVIRTYDFKKGVVRDHVTGKIASLKDVLGKGMLWLLKEGGKLLLCIVAAITLCCVLEAVL